MHLRVTRCVEFAVMVKPREGRFVPGHCCDGYLGSLATFFAKEKAPPLPTGVPEVLLESQRHILDGKMENFCVCGETKAMGTALMLKHGAWEMQALRSCTMSAQRIAILGWCGFYKTKLEVCGSKKTGEMANQTLVRASGGLGVHGRNTRPEVGGRCPHQGLKRARLG